MQHICVVLPLLEGRTQDMTAFMEDLDEAQDRDHDGSERRIGISRALWWLARINNGDHLVGYTVTDDFEHALCTLSASQDEFDLWFKERIRHATGLDLGSQDEDRAPQRFSCFDVDVFSPVG